MIGIRETVSKLQMHRRTSSELFFHMSCNPSDTEKLKASLNAVNLEKDELKRKLDAVEKDKANLEARKTMAERDLPRLKREADSLKSKLNKAVQEATSAGERVLSLEGTVQQLQQQLVEVENTSFAAGFRSYVTGFLAVDPEYDWSKFLPSTKAWVEQFKVDEAGAIEEKRLEIGLEVVAVSANASFQQIPLDMARLDAEGVTTEDVVGAVNHTDFQDDYATEAFLQQGILDSPHIQV